MFNKFTYVWQENICNFTKNKKNMWKLWHGHKVNFIRKILNILHICTYVGASHKAFFKGNISYPPWRYSPACPGCR